MAAPLRALFAKVGQGAMIEAPFHCPYGFNISLGDHVYMNAGCTILDTAPVTIGARTMLGPNVQIYCADHHRDLAKRAEGLEIAHPVTIGANVWDWRRGDCLAGCVRGGRSDYRRGQRRDAGRSDRGDGRGQPGAGALGVRNHRRVFAIADPAGQGERAKRCGQKPQRNRA